MRNLVPPAVAMRKMRLPKVVAIRQSRQQQAIFSQQATRHGKEGKEGKLNPLGGWICHLLAAPPPPDVLRLSKSSSPAAAVASSYPINYALWAMQKNKRFALVVERTSKHGNSRVWARSGRPHFLSSVKHGSR